MKNTIIKNAHPSGFSLVEIVLAMAIAAVALITLIGFLPQAMGDASKGADQTAIGLMLEDVHDRIEGAVLEEGPVEILDNDGNVLQESPFFYDQRGIFFDENKQQTDQDSLVTERFFRVEVEIVKPQSTAANVNLGEVLAVKIDLFWPVDDAGEAIAAGDSSEPAVPQSTTSYFTAAKTGPGWQQTDSSYEPKIEY